MKINVEFNTVEEMQEFAKLIGAPCKCSDKTVTVALTEEKEVKEDNSKTDKKNVSKKSEKAKSEDKPKEDVKEEPVKEDVPKVEAEQVGVDDSTTEPPKDVEPTENEPKVTKVTKEQLRELCSNVMKSGKKSEIKAIFEKYGATKFTELKEEDRAAAYKDVEALQ